MEPTTSVNSKNAGKKRLQTESVVLRQMVMMQMLINNFGYTFVLCTQKRKATKTLCYYPIEKIYGRDHELYYDTELIDIPVEDRKIRYCQTCAIETMIRLLEFHGYQFKKKQTRKATDIRNGMQAITLTKLYSMSWNKDGFEWVFDMVQLEQTMGREYHSYIGECFRGGYEKLIIGYQGLENEIIQKIQTKKRIEGAVKVVSDCCDGMIEMEYCKGSYSYSTNINDVNKTK